MGTGLPVGPGTSWYRDVRGDRHLRVTVHDDEALVVVSVWNGTECLGTVRLALTDAAELTQQLIDGLARAIVLSESA